MKNIKKIVEKNPSPCFSFNSEGEVTYANPEAVNFLVDWNKQDETLLEDNLRILLYQNKLKLENLEIIAAGKYYSFEVILIEKDEYCFFGTDVTFQKNTADTLFNLIDDIDDALFLVDVDEQGIFVEVNRTAIKYLGYSREEMLTLSLKEIVVDFPLESQEDWQEHANKIKTKAGKHIENMVFRKKDGSTFTVEVVTSIKNVMEKDYQVILAKS